MEFSLNQAMFPQDDAQCGICDADFEPRSVWVLVNLSGTGEMVCEGCLRWIGERAEAEPELGWPTFAHYERALRLYPEPVYPYAEGVEREPDYGRRFAQSEIWPAGR